MGWLVEVNNFSDVQISDVILYKLILYFPVIISYTMFVVIVIVVLVVDVDVYVVLVVLYVDVAV